MNLVRKFNATFDRLLVFMAFLAGILFVFATLSVTTEVVLRYFVGQPLSWVIEISEYILLYITFLVAAWVLKGDEHIKVDLLLNFFNRRTQALINFATSTISTAVCLILTWFGIKVTWDLFQSHYFTVSILMLPKFIFIGIIAFGYLILSIQSMRMTHGYFETWRTKSIKKD